MEMRGKQEIELGEDITPPILPLSFSLHDSFLSSHCSSCFSPFPPSPFLPLPPSLPRHRHCHAPPLYCSPACSSSHSPLYSSSAESLLPQPLPPSCPDSSDLRTALRLLRSLPSPACPHLHRIAGLLTNRHLLTSSPEFAAKIREGATAMAEARQLLHGSKQNDGVSLEEAVLSLVITNAVEVQDDSGRSLGIAVYGPNFSWINHSCSPNACYRFSISPPNTTPFREDSTSTLSLRIVPSLPREAECNACSSADYPKGNWGYELGPKIIVRSIKRINEGEEVCVSYIDLLQPKVMRQSDLWFKYQFTCSCSRCSAAPLTYVDRALGEISASDLSFPSSSFDTNVYRVEGIRKLSDYVDDTITEFLSVGDPESCCKKLEDILNQGLRFEQSENEDGNCQLYFGFHPFHHIALNAYTTLASAYRIRSSDLLALHSEIDEYRLKAFDMSRYSAAYSLLLAGAAHHLFRAESSLIVSAANFWTNAGESLLTLARSSLWKLFISELSTIANHKCSKCSLMNIFDARSILSQAERANLKNISSDFDDCVSYITPKIWKFLVHGCHFLETVEDPFDFSWLGHVRNFRADSNQDDEDSDAVTEDSILRPHIGWYTNETRIQIYEIGFHCLLYGGILAHICYGQKSYTINM